MTTKTKHSETCKRVFGRYDQTCSRCVELTHGATPRQGWGALNKQNEKARLNAIAKHDFSASNPKHIGGVCVCFDW